MKAIDVMTLEEVLAESRRRDARRAQGLPLHETPAEIEERIAEDDARLEKVIQTDVVKLYRAHGCVVFSLSQPRATKQTPGIADLYVFCPSAAAAWWHEVKTPTGKQSPAQVVFQQFCESCHVGYVLGGVLSAAAKLDAIGATR